jgi:ATP-dependent Clp protease protease subunit
MDLALAKGASAIWLEVTTYGGDYHTALAIINRIRECPLNVITVASGAVFSSGVPIVASGNKRLVKPYTHFMIHELSSDFGGQTKKLISEMKQMELEQLEYCRILEKYSKTKALVYKELMATEHYFSPSDAINYGLIDEMIEEL